MTDVTGIEYTTTHDWKPAHFTPPEIAEAQVAAANAWQDYDAWLETKPEQPDEEWTNRLAELSAAALDAYYKSIGMNDEYRTAENRRAAAINIASMVEP